MKNRSPLQVLVVDPDEADQRAFRGMVRDDRLPYAVESADSVAAAKQALGGRRFDVIVSDYTLDDGTALDVFETAPGTAGIIVTGAPEQQVAVRSLRAGAFEYVARDGAQSHLRLLPRAIEDALRHREEEARLRILAHALRSIEDAVYVTTPEDRIVFVNRAFCQAYGYTEAEVLGRTSDLLWRTRPASDLPHAPGAFIDWSAPAVQQTKWGADVQVELSRSAVRDEDGSPVAVVRVARDLTTANAAAQEVRQARADLEKCRAELHALSVRDELTGLYNRRELERLLRDELARTARHGRPAALVFVDLDALAAIHEEHGEKAGEEAVRRAGQVLREAVRMLDRPARWAGAQLAVLLPETDAAGAQIVAERLRDRIAAERLVITRGDGALVNLSVTACAGFAAAPADAGTPEELLAAAERALSRARSRGRGKVSGAAQPA